MKLHTYIVNVCTESADRVVIRSTDIDTALNVYVHTVCNELSSAIVQIFKDGALFRSTIGRKAKA